MRITFKDVGQGDSIILEWDGKIGIIDCNLKGDANPVLDHIRNKDYKEIEFIILSHPHKDHYSGFLQLLEYAEKSKVIINRVGHTLIWAGNKKFWKYFEIGSKDTKLLNKIIQKWKSLKVNGIIKRMDNLADGKVIALGKDLDIICLAPSHDDAELYQKIVKTDADANVKEASQAANLLSTILKLNIGDCSVLLTSDAENSAFLGVIKRDQEVLNRNVISLCQLPHHGSEKNYSEDFWVQLNTAKNKHAIISAGIHRKYNHPSYQIIKNFADSGYSIHCTNHVNGMKKFVDHLNDAKAKSLLLDTCSSIAHEYSKSNDRIFERDGLEFKVITK